MICDVFSFFSLFLLILERWEGREKERKRNINQLPLLHVVTRDECEPTTQASALTEKCEPATFCFVGLSLTS